MTKVYVFTFLRYCGIYIFTPVCYWCSQDVICSSQIFWPISHTHACICTLKQWVSLTVTFFLSHTYKRIHFVQIIHYHVIPNSLVGCLPLIHSILNACCVLVVFLDSCRGRCHSVVGCSVTSPGWGLWRRLLGQRAQGGDNTTIVRPPASAQLMGNQHSAAGPTVVGAFKMTSRTKLVWKHLIKTPSLGRSFSLPLFPLIYIVQQPVALDYNWLYLVW